MPSRSFVGVSSRESTLMASFNTSKGQPGQRVIRALITVNRLQRGTSTRYSLGVYFFFRLGTCFLYLNIHAYPTYIHPDHDALQGQFLAARYAQCSVKSFLTSTSRLISKNE